LRVVVKRSNAAMQLIEVNEMPQQYALLSIVFMIVFVMRFERVHRHNARYRMQWAMHRALETGVCDAGGGSAAENANLSWFSDSVS
jgi:hypothetical protein